MDFKKIRRKSKGRTRYWYALPPNANLRNMSKPLTSACELCKCWGDVWARIRVDTPCRWDVHKLSLARGNINVESSGPAIQAPQDNKAGYTWQQVRLGMHTKYAYTSDFMYVWTREIIILEWFLKDHVTLKTGVMMLKIQLYHHRNKLHFKIHKNRKVTLNCNNISQYCWLLI